MVMNIILIMMDLKYIYGEYDNDINDNNMKIDNDTNNFLLNKMHIHINKHIHKHTHTMIVNSTIIWCYQIGWWIWIVV